MPELSFSVKNSGTLVLFGSHTIIQTLGLCLPPWLTHEPLLGPFLYPAVRAAVEGGQVLREQPVLALCQLLGP